MDENQCVEKYLQFSTVTTVNIPSLHFLQHIKSYLCLIAYGNSKTMTRKASILYAQAKAWHSNLRQKFTKWTAKNVIVHVKEKFIHHMQMQWLWAFVFYLHKLLTIFLQNLIMMIDTNKTKMFTFTGMTCVRLVEKEYASIDQKVKIG